MMRTLLFRHTIQTSGVYPLLDRGTSPAACQGSFPAFQNRLHGALPHG